MKKIVLFLIFILILIGGFILVKVNILDKNIIGDYRIIHYSYKDYDYDIKLNEDKIDVIRFKVVQCVKEPCDPIKDKEYSVSYKDGYKNRLDRLFKDSKEITLKYNEVDKDIEVIILDIISIKEDVKDDRYSITNSSGDSTYKEPGYYVNNNIVIVALGERNTGGYSINVDNIIIENNDVYIYVKESSPSIGESVTMAFTYPIVKIEFKFKPNKIEVRDVDTFNKYEKR